MSDFTKSYDDTPPDVREFALNVLWAKSYLRGKDRTRLIMQSKHHARLTEANDNQPVTKLWELPIEVRDVGLHGERFAIVADGVDQVFNHPFSNQ